MVDLLVLGAGVAGTAVARCARARSLDVAVVADPAAPPASTAALGLVRLGWLGGVPDGRALGRRSLALWREWDLLLPVAAQVRRPGGPFALDRDYFAVDVDRALAAPDRAARVVAVAGRTATLADGEHLTARLGVVVCAGVGAAAFGARFARLSHGATAIWAHAGPPRLVVTHLGPYRGRALVTDGARARFGSSTTADPAAADGALHRDAAHCAVDLRAADVLRGARAHAAEPVARRGDLTILAGLGKLGYALAPALAERIVAGYLP